jgi:aspartate kinase
MEQPLVSGVALDRNQARVSLIGVADRPGIAAEIFSALANQEINVDVILQTVAHDGTTNIDFTVPTSELHNSRSIVKVFIDKGEIKSTDFNETIAKVSIVGVGMKSHAGVAAKAFNAMAEENINIRMISTSEIKVSMVIEEKYSELAVRALHSAFELDK